MLGTRRRAGSQWNALYTVRNQVVITVAVIIILWMRDLERDTGEALETRQGHTDVYQTSLTTGHLKVFVAKKFWSLLEKFLAFV